MICYPLIIFKKRSTKPFDGEELELDRLPIIGHIAGYYPKIIDYLNRLGILFDISRAFSKVLSASTLPSHSIGGAVVVSRDFIPKEMIIPSAAC
jgi:hypothetical protein